MVDSNSRKVAIIQGLEELGMESALHFLTAVSHLLVVDPTSSIFKDVHQHYNRVFPAQINFWGHQSYHTVDAACRLFVPQRERQFFQWSNYKPSTHEHTIVAHSLLKLAQSKYQRVELAKAKVPRVILYFSMYSLSLDPPPPTSVLAGCLLIIATELDCDILEAGIMTLDERCVHL